MEYHNYLYLTPGKFREVGSCERLWHEGIIIDESVFYRELEVSNLVMRNCDILVGNLGAFRVCETALLDQDNIYM